MGKKDTTIKNIVVVLGCTAFAGAYAIGACSLINHFADERSARPAWLDKVEIHVDAKGANGTVMQTFDRAGVDAPVPVGSGVRGDSNDRPGAGDVLQNAV